ncbi:MAG: hypothetical protein ACKOUT_03775 [Novosphingobium sp.]
MQRSNNLAVAACFAMTLTMPAMAQTGATPEAAQKFIEIVLKQGATRAEVSDIQRSIVMDQGWNCGGMSTCYETGAMSGQVYWMGAPDKCTTSVYVTITDTSWRRDHGTVYVKEHPKTNIVWSSISGALLSTGGYTISLAGSGRVRSLTFATPELAARVKNAFSTLIKACDPTAGTGF